MERMVKTPASCRRWVLATAASLALVAPAAAAPAREDSAARQLGWRLSLQAWTFHQITLFETIDRAQALGIRAIELFPGQKLSPDNPAGVGPGLKPEERAALKRKLASAGIVPVNYGVTGLGKDEAGARPVFEFARDMGIETLCAEPDPATLPMLDRLAGEYGINIAIHNHPKPSRYWDSRTVVDACKGCSRRVGACADTGHWMRSGLEPIEQLRKLEGRIVTFHLKDVNGIGKPGIHDVPWGTGAADFRGMMAEMRRQGFTGAFSIEYEHWTPELMDNLAKCVATFDATAAEVLRQAPAETGAFSLFDGRGLAGWSAAGGPAKPAWSATDGILSGWILRNDPRPAWSVEDGVLVGRGGVPGCLRSRKAYESFALRFECRNRFRGCAALQVNVADGVGVECGGEPGQWATYDLIRDGGELIVKRNGAVVSSATGRPTAPGRICLRAVGGGVELRHIRVVPIER